MTKVRLFPRSLRAITEERAIAFEKKRRAEEAEPTPLPEPDHEAEAILRLSKKPGFPVGTAVSGLTINMGDEYLKSGIVLGASGSGKTRWTVGQILARIDAMAAGLIAPHEIEVIDPKGETARLLCRGIAERLLLWSPEKAEWLRNAVRIIEIRRDAATPMPPFDNADGTFTDAYLADFRTQVMVEASGEDYTDAVLHEARLFSRVLVDLRAPINFNFAFTFYTDDAFRIGIVPKLKDPILRRRYANLAAFTQKQTISAFLRRYERRLSFDLMRVRNGVPPRDVDRLFPKRQTLITIGTYVTSQALPPAMAWEQCAQRYFELLLSVPVRNTSRPLLIVAEEFGVTLAAMPSLARPITQTVRTARGFDVGLHAIAQDIEGTVESDTVRSYILNARFLVAFQCRDEAAWLAPHFADSGSGRAGSAARQDVQRMMENLPPREFALWIKGEGPVVRLRSLDVPTPGVASGKTPDELDAVFDREIASRWLLSTKTADELIATWEAEVIGRKEIAPSENKTAREPIRSMDDLLRGFRDEPDSEDPRG